MAGRRALKLFQCLDSLETLLEALPLHGVGYQELVVELAESKL